jgi:hypothetical protein
MLRITEKDPHGSGGSITKHWHFGERAPEVFSRVVEFQADGDELVLFMNAMSGTHGAVARETDQWAVTSSTGPQPRSGAVVIRLAFAPRIDAPQEHGWLFGQEAALELASELIRSVVQARRMEHYKPEKT